MASPYQRPDIAAMQATLPSRAGPSPADRQAAAHAPDHQPYVEFDGARWYLRRAPDMFDLGELGEAVDRADIDPMGALGVMNRCLREWLADYPGLRARFRTLHTTGADDAAMDAYVGLAQGIFEAVTARPTEAPDGSSTGRAPTSTSSTGAPASATAAAAWTRPGSNPG